MRTDFRLLLALAFAFSGTSPLVAQCSNTWVGGYGCPGTNGWVFDAVLWDPDGAGPAPPVVALGGPFTLAGDVACQALATWDPATGAFAALPAPPLPYVHCLEVASNGDLLAVVSGYLGGAEIWQVASLGASGWTTLGNGFAHAILDLHVRPTGEIVVAGQLDPFGGGASLGAAARWNGASWVSLGSGGAGFGWALSNLANGDLALGTNDNTSSGVVSWYYTWNGTTLTPFPGTGPVAVSSLVLAPTGELFAGANGLWSWNGTTWVQHVPPPSAGVTGGASRLACTASGDVLVSCTHTGSWIPDAVATYSSTSGSWNVLTGTWAGVWPGAPMAFVDLGGLGLLAIGTFANVDGRSMTSVARWNGSSWQPLHDGPPAMPECVAALAGNRLAIGGAFASCGTIATANVAEWTGSTWLPLGQGLDGTVHDLLQLANGDLLAGGDFTASGAVAASGLVRWNGTAWSQFGGGVANTSGPTSVRGIAALPNGDLVVAGAFTAAGGVPTANVARWNGASWSPLGAGAPGAVSEVAAASNGDVWVVLRTAMGSTEVRQWNGATWTTIASYGSSRTVLALAVLADGTMVLGGSDQSSYSPGLGFVSAWDPVSGWSTATADWLVTEIVAAPDGDAIVFGNFQLIGPIVAPGMARMHRGAFPTWSAGVPSWGVHDAVFTPSGELLTVGSSDWPIGLALHGVARLTTTCPASATASGSGCTGSGGPNLLNATSLPWLGGVFASVATGMAANGLAVGVLGLGTAALPLASILPQGVAGCTLLVTPDLLGAYVPTAGAVTSQLAIPNLPAFVNQTLHQQFVSLEITAGAIAAVTSTNALTVTIGQF